MVQTKSFKKRVVVAMSGGIDSSVAAALLKKQGFEASGVFMKFWTEPSSDGSTAGWNRCCNPEAEKRARWIALSLGIPFFVLNLEKEFKKIIVDDFLKEYKAGRIPNPCVICNKEIKFGLLLKKALAMGADFVATGHYARLQTKKNTIHLIKGKDKEKDQSYFLWQLNQNQLKHILFPVGKYTKPEVRNLAKKFRLPVLDIPESQEVCFVRTTLKDFLVRYIKLVPGPILANKGKEIGQHQGLPLYTIGQRKGIGLAGGPYYVLKKNLKRNTLIVTKNEKDLFKKELIAKNVNWISLKQSLRNATGQVGKEPKLPLKIKAKIRYRRNSSLATIARGLKSKVYNLRFDKPQKAITSGQSVVFYKGTELLGGGIIL